MSGELAGAADIIHRRGHLRARSNRMLAKEKPHRAIALTVACTLIGVHCHVCGQKAKVHRTLHAFGHDILHSVLHFDGKIWRTLPMLFWNPGELTRRYVHGERAKFVSPLALFLFTVFLTFAVFNWLMPKGGASQHPVVQPCQCRRGTISGRSQRHIGRHCGSLRADKKEADCG